MTFCLMMQLLLMIGKTSTALRTYTVHVNSPASSGFVLMLICTLSFNAGGCDVLRAQLTQRLF